MMKNQEKISLLNKLYQIAITNRKGYNHHDGNIDVFTSHRMFRNLVFIEHLDIIENQIEKDLINKGREAIISGKNEIKFGDLSIYRREYKKEIIPDDCESLDVGYPYMTFYPIDTDIYSNDYDNFHTSINNIPYYRGIRNSFDNSHVVYVIDFMYRNNMFEEEI